MNGVTRYSFLLAGTPNSGQQLNVQLANALYYLLVQVQRMLANMRDTLPLSTISIISDSLEGLNNLTGAIIQPLIGTFTKFVLNSFLQQMYV